jgi:F-type H+-transporting ATPase subunit beta
LLWCWRAKKLIGFRSDNNVAKAYEGLSVFAGVGSVPGGQTTCCANSSESNILYGDALCHLMEEGGWDPLDMAAMENRRLPCLRPDERAPEPGPGVALSGLDDCRELCDGDGTGAGRDILFFIDNIFRFTQAGSEASPAHGRMPRPWLPAHAGHRMGACTPRLKRGSITRCRPYVPMT